jgi:hypothetical protein
VHSAAVRNKMGIVLLKRFFRRNMADIHYALHNIVLPLSNVLIPEICQHKRITSIYC